MNKGELIKNVQRDTKLSKLEAKAAVESVIASLRIALKETAKVTLAGSITVQAVLPCPRCGALVRSNRLEKHKKKCLSPLSSQERKSVAESKIEDHKRISRKVAEGSKRDSKPKHKKKRKYKPTELEDIFDKRKRVRSSAGSKKRN
jgi:hypothetical protein